MGLRNKAVPKGAYFNALKKMPSYKPCWLFFDEDDKEERAWALQQQKICQDSKLILTGGSVQRAEKLFNAPIYFDQVGRLSNQLGIKSLPARVTRENNTLLVEEIALGGSNA